MDIHNCLITTFFWNDKVISSDDYEHTLQVWHVFECQIFKDYLHLYFICNVLYLSDLFESFRDKCVDDIQLNPAHYFSRLHFHLRCFFALLRHSVRTSNWSKSILFLEKGIQGHLLMVAKRYSKASNPHILGYHSSRLMVYILDLDSNNLHGKVIQDYLPYGSFCWMNKDKLMVERIMNFPTEGYEVYFVECMLD